MNKEVIESIKDEYFHYTDTYKLIADVIIKYPNEKFDLTVSEFSKQSYCAQSTIIKFINSLGYESFKVFKFELNQNSSNYSNNIINSFLLVDDYINQNFSIFQELTNLIINSNKVYFFASGMSRMAALDFCLKANKVENKKFIFELEANIQNSLVQTIHKDDLVIFISNSGGCKELVNFRKNINIENIFLITNREHSNLQKLCKNTINLNNTYETIQNFKEFSKDSKYSIIYFFDLVFENYKKYYQNHLS